MATEAPRTRRKFRSDWDEINYLYLKLLYWYYQRGSQRHALRYGDRLAKRLRKASPHHEAILGEECWSLLYEVKGDLPKAIQYRENEIRLIRHLWETVAESPDTAFVLKGYDVSDLSDRLDLLATLYHDAGDLDKALEVLRESKQLCESHDLPFDGEDLLRDYAVEKNRLTAGEVKRPERGVSR